MTRRLILRAFFMAAVLAASFAAPAFAQMGHGGHGAAAPATAPGPAMSGASGRFFQYFLGISDCIARTFSRAGLKMLRK